MKRNLGVFTCYDIEYIFDFLGEDKIKFRIDEMESTSSGSMGISLRDFTYNDSENSYFNGKGVLDIFQMIMQWFDDIQSLSYLYQSSKRYNENNYYDSDRLKKKWENYISRQQSNSRNTNNYNIEDSKSSYWTGYHFFYLQLSKQIRKEFDNKKIIETDILGTYSFYKNKLIGKLKLEVKTRRKPLTGQYLLFRDLSVWFNLEPKESKENTEIYQFIKNKNIYNLIIEKENSIAKIELFELNSYSENYIIDFKKAELDIVWQELIDDYIKNFENISSSIKQTFSMVPDVNLSNGVMWDFCEYFKSTNNEKKAINIIRLNNAHPNVWRIIPEPGAEI
jgi:hypothetical protein